MNSVVFPKHVQQLRLGWEGEGSGGSPKLVFYVKGDNLYLLGQ